MTTSKIKKFCDHCVNPFGLGAINPSNGKTLQFVERGGRLLCEICADFLSPLRFPDRKYFDREFDEYLKGHNKVIFAYSGGLDSTVVLALLSKECKKEGSSLNHSQLKQA
ncbi:MAG: hypothetical protein WCX77_02645 [Candidatus Paceibacterota bacterium]|jgi:hypothetical protein